MTQISSGHSELTERERLILRYIVQHFVLTANPVGSRYLSKRLEEESISAATIRNVMADLEEKGYITHPHTSAGRMPTDRGYRFYVDEVVGTGQLSRDEQTVIRKKIKVDTSPVLLIRETSRLLAAISDHLGIVTAPELLDGMLERLEIVPLSSSRLLVVLSLQAGLIKTVTIEIHDEVPRDYLDYLVSRLNERLVGLTLREIRDTCRDRLSDVVHSERSGVARLLVESADRIFSRDSSVERVHVASTEGVFRHPEFSSPEQLRGIVELMENEDVIVHLLEGHEIDAAMGSISITIGREHCDERMADYSLISTRYRFGETTGTIGLIGPKRMNYSKLIAVVDYIARTISSQFTER